MKSLQQKGMKHEKRKDKNVKSPIEVLRFMIYHKE